MKKLKFMKGYSYPRRRFNREEEILLLNQEIIDLKKRVETVEIKSFGSESPTQQTDQISKSLEVVRNIGNFKISESDSIYEKEEPFDMEKEMEMEG